MNMPVQPSKAIVGRNAFAHDGASTGRRAEDRQTCEIIDPQDIGLQRVGHRPDGPQRPRGAYTGQTARLRPHAGRAGRHIRQVPRELADEKRRSTTTTCYIWWAASSHVETTVRIAQIPAGDHRHARPTATVVLKFGHERGHRRATAGGCRRVSDQDPDQRKVG